MNAKRDVVIVSLPYQTPGWPATAPALLSACLNKAGITAVPRDLAAEFNHEFIDRPYWPELLFYISQGRDGYQRYMHRSHVSHAKSKDANP